MARPIARGVLSFGLVAIPVEIHTATKSQNVSFNLLHAKCGSRIRNQIFCPACKIVVERADLVRGYEVAKGEYVRLTDAELEALEAEANSAIELKEFIPISKVDPVYFEHAYYLAPDEGGEKPYRFARRLHGKSRTRGPRRDGEPRQRKTCAHPGGLGRLDYASDALRE